MAAPRRLFSFLVLAVLAVVGFWALNLDRGGWAATAITCAFFGMLLLVAQIPRLRQDDVLLNALLQACVGVLLLGGAALIAVLRLHSLSWLVALGAFLLGPVIVAADRQGLPALSGARGGGERAEVGHPSRRDLRGGQLDEERGRGSPGQSVELQAGLLERAVALA